MNFSVDIYQNAKGGRFTGSVSLHPDEGGPGNVIHEKCGYVSEDAAAIACDLVIERLQKSRPTP